jgi:hypothetical protein
MNRVWGNHGVQSTTDFETVKEAGFNLVTGPAESPLS